MKIYTYIYTTVEALSRIYIAASIRWFIKGDGQREYARGRGFGRSFLRACFHFRLCFAEVGFSAWVYIREVFLRKCSVAFEYIIYFVQIIAWLITSSTKIKYSLDFCLYAQDPRIGMNKGSQQISDFRFIGSIQLICAIYLNLYAGSHIDTSLISRETWYKWGTLWLHLKFGGPQRTIAGYNVGTNSELMSRLSNMNVSRIYEEMFPH